MTRLIQITDTHIYADPEGRFDGVDTRSSFERVLGHVRRFNPEYDALLLTGDMAMDGSAGAYAYLKGAFEEEEVPVLCLPGNHDHPRFLSASGLSANARTPYACAFGDWRVILLDTQVDDCAHGEIDADQMAWLNEVLDAAGDCFDAVFLHHHPVPIGSPWMDAMGLRSAGPLWSALNSHAGVRLVAFGHIHQNVDCYRAHVRVLGTPSTCAQFMPRASRHTVDRRAPGYRVIDLDAAGAVSTCVVRVPAPPG